MQNSSSQELTDIETDFNLNVSKDKLYVLLSCQIDDVDIDKLASRIIDQLKEMKIKEKPDYEAFVDYLNKAKSKGENLADYTLMKGVPAVMPVDGTLDWTRDFFKKGYDIDPETKCINFRQKAGNPNVEEGALLVKVNEGRQGKPGRDVYGRTINVSKPRLVFLKAGPGVVWKEEESSFYAKCAGRVVLKGQTLEIDKILHIKKNVGNETGNIKHSGQVIINGDIDSEFSVESTGDIEVRGLIYACDIKCDGNLIVKEGINENSSKRIYVKGNILVGYIMNANIVCDGQVLSNREIFQSEIKSRDNITCKKGRIVGGETMTAKCIYVGEVGSKGNTKTTLIAGVDYYLLNKLKVNEKETDQLKSVIRQLKPVWKKLDNMRNYLKPEQKEAFTEVGFELAEANEGLEKIEEENKEIRKEINANKHARIVIYNTIYPGTILRIADSQYIVEETFIGPIAAGIDPATCEISLSSKLESNEEQT